MEFLEGINQINVEMKHIICENWKQFNQIQFIQILYLLVYLLYLPVSHSFDAKP